MKRIFVAALVAIACGSAIAGEPKNIDNMPIWVLSKTADDMPLARDPGAGQTTQPLTTLPNIVIQQPPATFDAAPSPVVTVSPPKETVAFGDYAGALLNWLAVLLIPILAPFAADLYVKFRARIGLQTSDAERAKFQEIVENGVALGAHNVKADLSGKLSFDVKNQIMANAVSYAKAHGADTLKAIGVDPTSPEAEQAIRARAAKMLANLDASATAVTAGVPATSPSPLAAKPDAITTDASA